MKTIKLMFITILGIAMISACKKDRIEPVEQELLTEQELAISKARDVFNRSKWVLVKGFINTPKDGYYVSRALNFNSLTIELNFPDAAVDLNSQKFKGSYSYSHGYNFSQVAPTTFLNYELGDLKQAFLTDDEKTYLVSASGIVSYSQDGKYFSLTNDYYKTYLLFQRIN